MGNNKQPYIKYLNREWSTFKKDLFDYAKYLFGETVNQDFSEASSAGMWLEMMAYVGDVLSYYQDFQFSELFPESVKQISNLRRLAKMFGYKITGPSSSSVKVKFSMEVPANNKGNAPNSNYLITIKSGTKVSSNGGISFVLIEDIRFSEYETKGDYSVASSDTATGKPLTFLVEMDGMCVSGDKKTDTISISSTFVPFRRVTLEEIYISNIESVTDSDGNEYYEVNSLAEDTVIELSENVNYDSSSVPYSMVVKNAPFRYVTEYNPETGLTTLIFGSGRQANADDDAIPDPSDYALPLYGKSTLSRVDVNPNQFLNTKTLGVSPYDTKLTVEYYYGGGVDHNVATKTIRTVDSLVTDTLTTNLDSNLLSGVISSIKVNNESRASGGNDAPTFEDIRRNISANFGAQSRIVTKEDMIARIYSMPSQFGRVFRAGISKSESFPNSTIVNILTRDESGDLDIATDTLKDNIKKYLEQYRMITDSVEILDASIVNFAIKFGIVVSSEKNKDAVLSNVANKLTNYFDIENWQIAQPIVVTEVEALIYGTDGVISVFDLGFEGKFGSIDGRSYSDIVYDLMANKRSNIIFAPESGIFELKYPKFDISGRAV